jgi:protein FRA10AC1
MDLDAYSRHKKYINDYVLYYGDKETYFSSFPAPEPFKSDLDVLKEEHKFVRSAADDVGDSYEKRLAKKYYNKLFKEYCVADLRRYKVWNFYGD